MLSPQEAPVSASLIAYFLERSTRPAKAAEGQGGAWDDEQEWSLEKVGQSVNSEKKVRKVRRDVVAQADTWASEGREAATDE